jgi:hypothetical protein
MTKKPLLPRMMVYLQSFFTGDRSVLGPVDVGFIDLSPNKKWKSTIVNADDDVGTSGSANRSIYEDEVLTEETCIPRTVAFCKPQGCDSQG